MSVPPNPSYLPRIVDHELTSRLASLGAVLIEGPKACGKTETARQRAASEVRLDIDATAREAASVDPSIVLQGPRPRLIDEWQLEPKIWNHVRRAVDDSRAAGQFILTGSAVPADDETQHSGALRIGRLRMRPMSLFESGHSSGEISLAQILAGDSPRSGDPGSSVSSIVDRICVGGWPSLQTAAVPDALVALRDYIDDVRRVDINNVDATRRDPERVLRLLRSLARNIATSAAITKIAADTNGPDGELSRPTIYNYLVALERLLIIEDQPAWQPHLRSKAQSRVTPKRHFVDPSLAVAALGTSPAGLLADLNYLGYLFESLVVRDLRVYAQANDAEVSQYRDNEGLEVDAIVKSRDGRWAAFEVKLGGEERIDEGSRQLLAFAERVDTSRAGTPALLAVVVASGYGYVRNDGVVVIPITALKD